MVRKVLKDSEDLDRQGRELGLTSVQSPVNVNWKKLPEHSGSQFSHLESSYKNFYSVGYF